MGHQIGSASDLTRKQIGLAFAPLRTAVVKALQHVDDSRRVCVQAGQLLREMKERCAHGEFLDLVEEFIPEISARTATTWMRAAESVTKALNMPQAIDVDSVVTPLSEIIGADDKKLSDEGRKLKQQWFNFTEGKTIKDCIAGVVVDGDAAHRIDRAINGKTKGGKGNVDRKDYPLFIGRKLSDLNTHLSHYKNFTGPQLERVELLTKQHVAKMPSGYLELLARLVKEEIKSR